MMDTCHNDHRETKPRPQARFSCLRLEARATASSLGGSRAAFARSRFGLLALCVLALATIGVFPGCVRRTLQITTQPPQALVFLNDQEIGRSEVSTDFVWYGDYDIVIRKKGYQTLKTNWQVKAPWYQWVPIDFFFEVLWPAALHDVHTQHFELEPIDPPTHAELLERATQTRQDALLAPD